MVGTVDRHKRQDVAIAAVRALRDRGLEAELTLLGLEADRAYAAELREQARDLDVARQVHFAGPTSDVAARLLAADALLLPAGEVTPLVLMEAMALRTPGGRGAHGQHPRRRHRRGERPAGRAGRPGRACRGGRSPPPRAGPCATGSPKRDAAAWRRTSTRRGRTAG